MTTRNYVLPVEQTQWELPTGSTVVFHWDYDPQRSDLLRLYEKGKELQWNTNQRLDWSEDVDPANPLGLADEVTVFYGTPVWQKMDDKGHAEIKRHLASWQFSQFLHGEQGALVCTSRIVESVPLLDAKFYAATQVMDEARHVETYSRFLREKIGFAYPINPHLKTLLNQVLSDGRWDMIYLGMQILIEGLALAAFNITRDLAQNPLVRALNAYVMQDEARHVAFGRMALRAYYPQLSEREREEREEFVVESSYLMRERFLGEEVWQNLGFGTEDCKRYVFESLMMREYRRMLFSRIVPIIKDIGLWGPRVRKAYEDMGVLGFENLDPEAQSAADEQIAREMDVARQVADQPLKVLASG
jgi:hypothetical protein